MSEVRYMISDAADKLQMEAHVLRYWEEELELDVPRNEMGHRYYTEGWLKTFEQIQLLKDKGYQLRAIKLLIHNQKEFEGDILTEIRDTALVTVDGSNKMEQFQTMLTAIVKNALAENNQQLGAAVSEQVGDRLIKEMNYLMREREEQEEARFRKLDESIRDKQKKLRVKKESGWKRKGKRKKAKNEQQNVLLTP